MKNIRSILLVLVSMMALSSNAVALGDLLPDVECKKTKSIFPDCKHSDKPGHGSSHAVPEIDAAGGVVAIGLLVGLMGLIRERRRNK